MNECWKLVVLVPLLSACASGGPIAPNEPLGQPCVGRMLKLPETDESKFGPLEVGADWQGYVRQNTRAFPSRTHGGRTVDVYVNQVGAAVYGKDDPFPEGTVIVKTSKEISGEEGPIFVMRKEAAGYAPEHEDWSYAIHWAKPTPSQAKLLGGPIYWRGRSAKVEYCWKCHDNYDRGVGGVPKGVAGY